MNRRVSSGLAVLVALTFGSCSFDGVQEMNLPGTAGTGDDALVIVAELPDAGTLTVNAEVRVDEVVVGTVTDLAVDDWHAVATLSLEPDVDLPANVEAGVGVNSLLGAAYVELREPKDSRGELAQGARIPLERGHAYPSTEQVLSTASLALNGGGFEQIATITHELNQALGGNDHAVAALLPRLDGVLETLNDQREDITATLRNVDRLANRYAASRDDILAALDEIAPALQVLSANRPDLTKALNAVRELGAVATPLVREVKDDLIANLADLTPALRALARSGPSLITGLGFALSFPFDATAIQNACRGSYCNMDVTVDLTIDSLLEGFLTPDGDLAGLPDLLGLPLNDLLDALGLPGLLGLRPHGLGPRPGTDPPRGDEAPGNLPLDGLLGGLL